MKESRYVKLARTILHVLRYARIPLFLHRRSNHIFTVWQHLSLLTIGQYEGKSYRMFTEWLVEVHYLRMFLQIYRIPHFTTLQKFMDSIAGTILQRMISSFIALFLINVKHIFFGIDSSGFNSTHSSQYYTERAKLRKKKKWIKLSVGADVLKQIICSIKIRRVPHARHDNIDFKPIITRTSEIKPLFVVVADKGYDSEENHVLVRVSKGLQHYSS